MVIRKLLTGYFAGVLFTEVVLVLLLRFVGVKNFPLLEIIILIPYCIVHVFDGTLSTFDSVALFIFCVIPLVTGIISSFTEDNPGVKYLECLKVTALLTVTGFIVYIIKAIIESGQWWQWILVFAIFGMIFTPASEVIVLIFDRN